MNLELRKARYKRYVDSHREILAEKSRLYDLAHHDQVLERVRKYYRTHKSVHRSKDKKRGKALRQATPPWANIKAINKFYEECPKGMEVDHIVPIIHPLVAGLHVLNNLQYLPIRENRSKSNKFVPHFEPVTINGKAI